MVHIVAIRNIVFWSVHALLAEICDNNGFLSTMFTFKEIKYSFKWGKQNPALKIIYNYFIAFCATVKTITGGAEEK